MTGSFDEFFQEELQLEGKKRHLLRPPGNLENALCGFDLHYPSFSTTTKLDQVFLNIPLVKETLAKAR